MPRAMNLTPEQGLDALRAPVDGHLLAHKLQVIEVFGALHVGSPEGPQDLSCSSWLAITSQRPATSSITASMVAMRPFASAAANAF